MRLLQHHQLSLLHLGLLHLTLLHHHKLIDLRLSSFWSLLFLFSVGLRLYRSLQWAPNLVYVTSPMPHILVPVTAVLIASIRPSP